MSGISGQESSDTTDQNKCSLHFLILLGIPSSVILLLHCDSIVKPLLRILIRMLSSNITAISTHTISSSRRGWKLGNINFESWSEIAHGQRRYEFAAKKTVPHAECYVCEYASICHGGCPRLRSRP